MPVEGINHRGWIVQGLLDDLECLVYVIDHVVIPKSQYEPPAVEEPAVTSGITGSVVVGIPVDFNREPPFKTHKVNDERADRLLPTETYAQLSPPKMAGQSLYALLVVSNNAPVS